MNQNKKPSWKERLSNWVPSEFLFVLLEITFSYLSGIAMGLSIATIIMKLRG